MPRDVNAARCQICRSMGVIKGISGRIPRISRCDETILPYGAAGFSNMRLSGQSHRPSEAMGRVIGIRISLMG